MAIDFVAGMLFEVARKVIVPRFRALAASEVSEKSPGEVVTVADREAEELISAELRTIADVPVVGEEAASADPGLLRAVSDRAWLVDPLDGTANFVAGSTDWAVMVARVERGETVEAAIVRPMDGLAYVAERGCGLWRYEVHPGDDGQATRPEDGARVMRAGDDGARVMRGGDDGARVMRAGDDGARVMRAGDLVGTRIAREVAPAEPGLLRGAALTRFLDAADRAHLEAAAPRFASVGPGARCAGVDYPLLIEGGLDFVLFHRTLPWDHAPGALLLTEAGGVSRRRDGTPYAPGRDGVGLLNAADPACWDLVRPILLPGD